MRLLRGSLLLWALAWLMPAETITLKEVRVLTLASPFTAIAFPYHGADLLTGDADGVVRGWEVKSGKELYSLRCSEEDYVASMRYADSRYLVVALAKRIKPGKRMTSSSLRILDMSAKKEVDRLDGLEDPVECFGFGWEGRKLFIGTGKPNLGVVDFATLKPRDGVKVGEGVLHMEECGGLGLLGMVNDRGDVTLFNYRTELIDGSFAPFRPQTKSIKPCLAGVPEKSLLAVGATNAEGNSEAELVLWHTVDNKLVRSLGPESYEAVSLAFSRDRDYLVSSHANDKCIKIWRVKTGELVFKEALPDVLAQVAATRNGLYLVGRAQAPACRITIWEFPKLPEN